MTKSYVEIKFSEDVSIGSQGSINTTIIEARVL